ncbi:ShET2/EspL2 family type III secretion system effector toxin [Candidatus Ichthyocystis sparus]|uniref:ShET2/EspL2 family type III secretion system effector toxin n=2 Tax=Candidatus Ichthyocystis sparus TaxID=1561004 RepID=UPI000B87045F|nr:ShET2/EspL2 family type III secretion system effector toxin [Candidatus Ichthyocystis sparus]
MACSSDFPVRVSSFSGEILLSSDKSEPYMSDKHVSGIAELNSKVQVDGKGIFCTHLSALYVSEGIKCHNSGRKFRIHDLFGNIESIRKAAPSNIHSLYNILINKSSNKYIIVCDRFGCFLHEVATNINVNNQRSFLLSSCSHVMALRVVCKLKTNHLGNDEYRYVVHFFDPNKTNVTARSEVSDPSFFLDEDKFSLRKFIGSNCYAEYFERLLDAPKEHELMVYECSDGDIVGSESLSRLETLLHGGISECALYHLMESGVCSKNIIMMSEKLSLLPSSVRETLVFGRSSGNVSALHIALSNNNHHSIQAYSYLLDSLSYDEKIRVLPQLLLASNASGESGLILAMQGDNADSVYAFANLLDVLLSLRVEMPASRLAYIIFDLLTSRTSSNDGSGLFMAMQEGSSSAIVAFGSLIDVLISLSNEVPASEIAEMIFTVLKSDVLKSDDGYVSGLFMAMQEGRSSAIIAFGSLLDKLAYFSNEVPALDIARMIFTILMSVNYRGITALCIAMHRGNSSSVCSFGKLLERLVSLGNMISRDHFEEMMSDILLASSYYSSGLFEALENNHVDSIREYCSLLSMISQSKWPNLLAAKDSYGITGILFANEGTVDFYFSILKEFTVDVLSELLSILENVRHTGEYIELASDGDARIMKYESFLVQLGEVINS